MSKVVHEGWMVRYGRRKIGKSFIHTRYFVLESEHLAYYKKKPVDKTKVVPLNSLVIDGNCRVEDKGVQAHHGHMVYVLCVYNKKEMHNRITMAALNIQEALIWKQKIELVIDQLAIFQQHALLSANDNKTSTRSAIGLDTDGNASSSDQESQGSPEEEDNKLNLIRETTNGPPDSVLDWTHEPEIGLSNQTNTSEFFPRKRWRLVRCQNGLRVFEELVAVDYLPRSCTKAMKAVGVVDASCEAVFELVMSMDSTRFEWDCSFQYGSLMDEVDGHTAIVYHRLQLEWFSMFVWPRDLCYVRYWRRNDDGSYVVLFQSREHRNCGPQKRFVRAHIESGGFKISPLKSSKGKARTQVQYLMQIDLKGWFVKYFPSFQQHCLLQMLNSVAGMREFFSQTDEIKTVRRIPVMVKLPLTSVSTKKVNKPEKSETHSRVAHSRKDTMMMDYSDEDDDNQATESGDQLHQTKAGDNTKQLVEVLDEKPLDDADLACFSGILHRDNNENGRNCWRVPDGNNFKVRGENYSRDKTKVPAGKYLMELVAVDWLKGAKRLDHVARRPGCAVQVAAEKGLFSLVINMQIPGSTHYSMIFYYVMEQLSHGSLLQQFVDGDDEFRNSRLKLIPSVHKGSWIVRQSVGSTPCLLGRALDCTYIRGEKYLEIGVDIGSSAVANGVLGLVLGVFSSLIVDIAFLVQAVTDDELPERLIGAVRVAHVELSSAIAAELDDIPAA